MIAAQIIAYGQADQIALNALNMPVPIAGEVVVQVIAAGVNPLDMKMMAGYLHGFFPVTFPYTLGTDFAGRISAVGSGVKDFAVGDAVMGRSDANVGGAFAAYLQVPVTHLARVPEDVSLTDLAGLPTTVGTAYQALFEMGNLKAGQTVLIQGGAGGVGRYAVQLAHHAGARVIATASAKDTAKVAALGADIVLDYANPSALDHIGEVDLALDTAGGAATAAALKAVRRGGVLLSLPQPFDTSEAEAKGVRAEFVVHLTDGARLTKLVALMTEGAFRPSTDHIRPLGDAADVLAAVASGTASGKTVLTFS